MKIGEILRAERERKGLSLVDIEEETKIRAKYLQALEDENYDEIPGEAYCMGFLRNYARFLGIDPDPLLYQYRSQVKKADLSPLPEIAEQTDRKLEKNPVRSSSERARSLFQLAIFVFLIFSIAFIFFSVMERKTPPSKPPVSQGEDSDKQQPEPLPKEEKINMQLVGRQRCWARVTVDGKVEYEGNLNSGDTREFEAKDSIRVRLGNAGGVDVIYNGNKEPSLGNSGQVTEKEYLRSS